MTIPTITPLPDPPQRSTDTAATFVSKADAWVAALVLFVTQLNAFAAALVAAAESVIAGVASLNGQTGTLTGFTENAAAQTLTNKTLTSPLLAGGPKEARYTITDGASVDIDPANGPRQKWTLGANRTPTATNFADGQYMTLRIADGTAYAVTWSTIGVVWIGGSAPALPTTGWAVIELWKEDGTVYGSYVGPSA